MPTRFAIDEHIGARLRQRRRLLGMTQQDLAKACGIRFQQVQKYECGANAMSATRLWQMAQVTNTPVSYFFEGLGARRPRQPHEAEGQAETEELVRTFADLDEERRRRLLDLVKAMGGPDS